MLKFNLGINFDKLFGFTDKIGLTKQSCGDDRTKYLQISNRRLVFVEGDYIGTYKFR